MGKRNNHQSKHKCLKKGTTASIRVKRRPKKSMMFIQENESLSNLRYKVNSHERHAESTTIYLEKKQVIGKLIGFHIPTENEPEIIFIVQLPRPDQEDIDDDSTNVRDITFSDMNKVAPKWTKAFSEAHASGERCKRMLIKAENSGALFTRR